MCVCPDGLYKVQDIDISSADVTSADRADMKCWLRRLRKWCCDYVHHGKTRWPQRSVALFMQATNTGESCAWRRGSRSENLMQVPRAWPKIECLKKDAVWRVVVKCEKQSSAYSCERQTRKKVHGRNTKKDNKNKKRRSVRRKRTRTRSENRMQIFRALLKKGNVLRKIL